MSKHTEGHRYRFLHPQDYVILGLGAAVGAVFVLGTYIWIHAF
ncbi:hypothetical protein [Arenibaculum pallidiluteum]|nr:hypothetical protein [Arenibaculum pallidiluteum]